MIRTGQDKLAIYSLIFGNVSNPQTELPMVKLMAQRFLMLRPSPIDFPRMQSYCLRDTFD